MKQLARIATTFLAVALPAAIVPATLHAQEAGIAVGSEAPAAMVTTLDGREIDLAKYYGERPVVLEFWATWCPLCKRLEPALQAAREKYGKEITFIGVGVSANQSAARQQEYVEKQHLGGMFVFDAKDVATKAFQSPHTSYIVVIDRHRKVVYTGVGADQDVDGIVKKALGASGM